MSFFIRSMKLGRYGVQNTVQSHLAYVATSRRFLTNKVSATTKITVPEPTIGYDLVLDRSVKIMVNVTERAMTSVLHTYCDARLIEYLGTNSNFDIIGCSDRQAEVDSVRELEQYSQCDLVSYSVVRYHNTYYMIYPLF